MSTPNDQSRHAMKPMRWALFWRRFFPYQLVRFVLINARMFVMIWKSHHSASATGSAPATGSGE